MSEKIYIYDSKDINKEPIEINGDINNFMSNPLNWYSKWNNTLIATDKLIPYPYIDSNGEIKEKSESMKKIEGIIPLSDGEYIEGGIIYTVPAPDNILKKVWNAEIREWQEGATQEDISNEIRRLEDEFIELNEQREKRIKYKFDTSEIEKKIIEIEFRINWVSKIILI